MLYIKTDKDYLFFKDRQDLDNWLGCQEDCPDIVEEGDAQSWFSERTMKTEKINLMVERKNIISRLKEIDIKLQTLPESEFLFKS